MTGKNSCLDGQYNFLNAWHVHAIIHRHLPVDLLSRRHRTRPLQDSKEQLPKGWMTYGRKFILVIDPKSDTDCPPARSPRYPSGKW